jgi:hypothetical protein
MAIAR